MSIRQSIRRLCYSQIIHSDLRNWRLIHLLRRVGAFIIAPADFRSARRKWLLEPGLSTRERSLLGQISIRVHQNDEMYVPFDAWHYLSVGLSALRCIEGALQDSGAVRGVRSVLDFPCGYGRVLRFLRARFPNAEITASEIDPHALEFCESSFRVKTVPSERDFTKLSASGQFDLIWCGSLLTHVNEESAAELLTFFHDHLSPGGACVFTTHGNHSADCMRHMPYAYGMTAPDRQDILSQYDGRGYGYADYPGHRGYGVSVVSHERMLSIARSIGSWKQISFLDRGWDNHQDTYVGTIA